MREFTIGLVRESGLPWNTGQKPYLSQLRWLHNWFTEHAVYQHDAAGTEQLSTARATLFRNSGTPGVPLEDCDGLSLCLAIMLGGIGYRPAVLLVDTDGSGVLSHAMVGVKTPMARRYQLHNPRPEIPGPPLITWNGTKQWLPLEVTKGQARADGKYGPGWLPPKTSVVIPITANDRF